MWSITGLAYERTRGRRGGGGLSYLREWGANTLLFEEHLSGVLCPSAHNYQRDRARATQVEDREREEPRVGQRPHQVALRRREAAGRDGCSHHPGPRALRSLPPAANTAGQAVPSRPQLLVAGGMIQPEFRILHKTP